MRGLSAPPVQLLNQRYRICSVTVTSRRLAKAGALQRGTIWQIQVQYDQVGRSRGYPEDGLIAAMGPGVEITSFVLPAVPRCRS
jgi:hypothetical protein